MNNTVDELKWWVNEFSISRETTSLLLDIARDDIENTNDIDTIKENLRILEIAVKIINSSTFMGDTLLSITEDLQKRCQKRLGEIK